MMRGKYVVVDNFFPVLLPDAMVHSKLREMNITSAGFFSVYQQTDGTLDVSVSGHSESLGIKSKPIDAAKIKTLLHMGKAE